MKEDKLKKRLMGINIWEYIDDDTDKIQKALDNTNEFLFNLDGISKKQIKKNIKGLKALKKYIKNAIKDYSESDHVKGYKKDLKTVKMAINILKKELEARKYQNITLDIEEDYDEELDTENENESDDNSDDETDAIED